MKDDSALEHMLEKERHMDNAEHRLKGKKADLNYDDTYTFFRDRAQKFNESNPYAVTLYQDGHPDLVRERHVAEIEKLLPLLQAEPGSRVLDIGCGIGRWSDVLGNDIGFYCGMDFSPELISIAQTRNRDKSKRCFLVGAAQQVQETLSAQGLQNFDRILLMGIMLYLNDGDVLSALKQAGSVAAKRARILLREPVAIEERLTLKDFYSEELKHNYNAVYRSLEELKNMLRQTLLVQGFIISQEGFLYNDNLNNRQETAQYYYLLER